MSGRSPVPILFLVRELNHGGIERDATKIAIHLDRSRFSPHVASYSAQGRRFDELRNAGVPMLHVPVSSLLSTSAVQSAWRFWRYVRRHNIRLVHAWDSSAIIATPLARVSGTPVVVSSTVGHRELIDARTRSQLRWTDRKVDAVIVNCEAMRRHLIEDEGVPANRIEICYNGVDTTEFYPAQIPRTEPLAAATLVIGTICVLRSEKTLEVLQEAFGRVRHLDPRMKLLIVGSGPELPKLLANSARLKLDACTVFVPGTTEVAKYLHAIDIFVICSRSEAFPNALLEAMASGRCTVGTDIGGIPELTGDNERGLLFRKGDAADLARKLELLIQDSKLRSELAGRAAKFAAEKLSIEIAAERMAEIYERLLRRKGAL